MSGTEIAIERVRAAYGGWRRDTSVSTMRADWERLFEATAVDLPPLGPVTLNDVSCAWVEAPDCDADRVLLYLHGGGFRIGSSRSHHRLMHDLSTATGVRVLGVDYRLCPDVQYPAAIDDVMAVWRGLVGSGVRADHIAIGGDSAGGNLALSLLLRLRDAGEALPAAVILLSAWTDLSASGASFETRADSDPIHSRTMIQGTARAYLGKEVDPADPAVSPLFARLAGLPPLLLQVGDRETVLSDTTDFAERARRAGVEAEAEVFPGMIHVFQQFPDLLPEARAAIERCGAFLRHHLFGDKA